MKTFVSEKEFSVRLREKLDTISVRPRFVTGPGRSGAIAAVYASHYLGIPFIPFKTLLPDHFFPILIIDTVEYTGKTLKSACRFYEHNAPIPLWVFEEPPPLQFWYENIRET